MAVSGGAFFLGGRILVVEDEPFIVDLIRSVLEDEEFVVTVATSPAEALGRALAERFDLAIMDFFGPRDARRLDLTTMTPLIEALGATPRILLTAMVGPGERSPVPPQFTAIVSKPFDVDDLLHQVRAALPPARLESA